MKKKFCLFLAATLLMGTLLTGCGGKEGASSEKPAEGAEPVEISFAMWDKNQEPAYQEIIKAFEEKNPNIKVNLQLTPWKEYWTKLEAGGTVGQMPDVFWMHPDRILPYQASDLLMNLDEVDGLDYANYPAARVEAYMVDGVHYGVPKDYDMIGLLYNKALFDAKGVAYPDDTWTEKELLDAAIALTDPENGVYGFSARNTNREGYYSFLYGYGGYVLSEDGTQSGFDTPEAIEAMTFYTDLVRKYKVSPTPEQFADTKATAMFASGKLAMMFLGNYNLAGIISDETIKDSAEYAIIPVLGKTRATSMNGLSYSVAATTEHPEEAKTFLAFLGSEEANILQGKYGAAIPAYLGTESAYYEYYGDYDMSYIGKMVDYAHAVHVSATKNEWEDFEEDTMTEALTGQITPEEACHKIADGVEKIIAAG